MTKQDILLELDDLVHSLSLDRNQIVIIGNATEILLHDNYKDIENIDIWVNPKYYDIIVSNENIQEISIVDRPYIKYIPFAFSYYNKGYGEIRLHRGDCRKPISRLIQYYNVGVEQAFRIIRMAE